MSVLSFKDRMVRNADDENIVLHAISRKHAIAEDMAVDHEMIRDSVKKTTTLTTQRINKALLRLNLQGIIGFTSVKNKCNGYAVYLKNLSRRSA